MLKRPAFVFVIALWGASAAVAQTGPALNAVQKQGQQILYTSCGLCHTAPNINSPHMAPALSKETLGGSVPDIVAFIKSGTATMPAFQYSYSDAELTAVAEYLKTIEPEHHEEKK